jgi:hypothetical protein
MSWLEALKNLDAETAQEVEICTAASSSATNLSECLTQQGAKSARRSSSPLVALLAPPHIRNSERHALRQGYREKDSSTQRRPWLDALKGLEEKTSKVEQKRAARVLSPPWMKFQDL